MSGPMARPGRVEQWFPLTVPAGNPAWQAETEQEIAELRADLEHYVAMYRRLKNNLAVPATAVVEAELPHGEAADAIRVADATTLTGALWVAGVIEHGGAEVIARVQRALDYVRLAGR